ncbi:hypothetical protein DKE43_11495 [Bacillus pumilus]|nr:hypothetical protein DKE43_11495 [Bacillus pumilus]PRS41816.1 hypothetical protein C6Y02_01295 [Bacillus sp. NMCC4]PRS52153.1 hypothetical protein C6Y00_08255 [Bacillus sp. GBSC66]PRS72160.1 hypothetical protein C6347_03770 [Bacillus sp. NMTD17]PRS75401.1 hypothetical protein C6Y03_07070 [Bacillus sp. LNXM65]
MQRCVHSMLIHPSDHRCFFSIPQNVKPTHNNPSRQKKLNPDIQPADKIFIPCIVPMMNKKTLLLFYTKTPLPADIQLVSNTKKRAKPLFSRFTLYLENKT